MSELNYNSKIINEFQEESILWAIKNLKRDIKKSCILIEGEIENTSKIDIRLKEGKQKKECYLLYLENKELIIEAADTMGFIYGIYGVSKYILGISPFWFWNDQKIEKKKGWKIEEDFRYESRPFAVRLRGWFINDEVLIHTWYVDRRKNGPWEMAFESLLRCGGNMIIPGTDKNAEKYQQLASDMGLAITHHHSQPLGAEMFARAYPDLQPSFEKYPDKFRKLWREGIQAQKGMKVIWSLGFRGQGDNPFWENDPRYNTKETRGALMSSLIKEQYDMVKSEDKEAICCTNLYGETMELYKEGCLELPDDVIKIWADNGYGKMVTRRQDNHNPRVLSLPNEEDHGKHGLYYHVSFYDLQAANHMTMLPNSPEFVKKELSIGLKKGVDDYWIINCSNIKPHTYYLDFIAEFWQQGDIDIEEHRRNYLCTYYGRENVGTLCEVHKKYFQSALKYGMHEDEHAGEQFSNHVARILIHQFVKDRNKHSEALEWATKDKTLEGQIEWYKKLCNVAVIKYRDYMRHCEESAAQLSEKARALYDDTFMLQAKIHLGCFEGANKVCEALLCGMQEQYKEAFYHAGVAKKHYEKTNLAMREREHGKWHGFYENECLTDVKQTAWVLNGLMSYLRNIGDGPHYYQWQREFLYAEEDRKVTLVMNMENHLTDEEVFALMDEKSESVFYI